MGKGKRGDGGGKKEGGRERTRMKHEEQIIASRLEARRD